MEQYRSSEKALYIEGLRVEVAGRLVVRDVSLRVRPGEIHAIMGPNASGKTSLAYAIMGHPLYRVVGGRVYVDGEDITDLPPEERFRRGVFLAFQIPPETMVKTRTLYHYLARRSGVSFTRVMELMKTLGLSESILDRYLNRGFSGGEMKRSELLQLYLSSPRYAILDEPDSGVDIDGINTAGRVLRELRERGSGVIVITHIGRVFREVSPDIVHVMIDGRIVVEGGADLLKTIDERGYEYIKRELGVSR